MRVYRDIYDEQGQLVRTDAVYDIMECQYSGDDMGKRSVTATIEYPTPIAFQIGDYIKVEMQDLLCGDKKKGGVIYESFYIYTEPQCKKTARPMSVGNAFEITVTFYPRQYELSTIQMRDFLQQSSDGTPIVYTGFDEVTFYGGAYELLERCMACLAQHYVDKDGNPLWKYELADSVNENENTSLERFTFSFSQQSVMDALLKLNEKEGINTTFFINGRTIYVGFKRPYLCKVDKSGDIENTPLKLMYGKTSHESIDLDHGGLYDITKSVKDELPITKLFAYGASRNINRYYCSDRIKSGRFVNKLMLPSFSDDGKTDYVISDNGVKKYGIVEGSHTFEEIYPSLRYMTYADIRGIKYCIKIKASGLTSDKWNADNTMTHQNSNSTYPIARVQCYKVEPSQENPGVNRLVECAPPDDIAVYIHATGKIVKVVLYGGKDNEEALQKQLAHDVKVPTRDGDKDYIYGSCFCVHDNNFDDTNKTAVELKAERDKWFDTPTAANDRDSELNRIEYVDTFWLTDLYIFESYTQEAFNREGYSAWAYPRFNSSSNYPDNLLVNEVVAVEPVVIPDTSDNVNSGRQQHWDIYLRDLGFAIDEQNDFGEMVFVFATPIVSVLDGTLAGREFTIDGGNINNYQDRVVCAYKEDGTFNDNFYTVGDSLDDSIAPKAFAMGAVWRIRLNRNDSDEYLNSIGVVIPNTDIQMKAGDHIVLLDIYMPDIYVRAAENRLLYEAKKYLAANDKGNVEYSVSFDKVRINQIPNYALQMREGVQLRVVDEDLNITSDNIIRSLIDYPQPNYSNVPLFENESEVVISEPEQTYTYYSDTDAQGRQPKFSSVCKMEEAFEERGAGWYKLSMLIPKQYAATNVLDFKIWEAYQPFINTVDTEIISVDDKWAIIFYANTSDYNLPLIFSNTIIISIKERVNRAKYTKVIKGNEDYLGAICKEYIEFQANKHYEVSLEVDNKYWDETYKNGAIILTSANNSIFEEFVPTTFELTKEVGTTTTKLTYKFHLPMNFNDNHGYYIGVWYHGDAISDYAKIGLQSVIEKDIDENGNTINYVDFLVSSVNIKITDNTRPDDTRIIDVHPEPIRDISAQITEQTNASTWGQLMNNVHQNAIEIERAQKTYEAFVQDARLNYQQLLNLKDAIFDPDGTCKDTFIQTMMLQVGADSMNYQLEKTFTTPTGVQSNFSVEGRDSTLGKYDIFSVYENDILSHFVYTQGGQGGKWEIAGRFSSVLAPTEDGTFPTYYVCIRCNRNNANNMNEPSWICSTKQYAVNDEEDTNYWYFNWGILIPDNSGHYKLTETRGNAYMYGDNIIAGKISTIAGNSYFDLTHGNFVLSDSADNSPALSYIDGKLTISGYDNIGGENLCPYEELTANYFPNDDHDSVVTKILCEVENGKKYIGTLGELVSTIPSGASELLTETFIMLISNDDNINLSSAHHLRHYKWGEVMNINLTDYELSQADVLYLAIVFCNLDKVVEGAQDEREIHSRMNDILDQNFNTDYYDETREIDTMTARRIMIQQGEKATNYNTYYNHLTNALHGSTEITGGLVMTNVLALKDEDGNVTAGMSGLKDDGIVNIDGVDRTSQGVAMFSGGTYEDALKQAMGLGEQLSQLLPILLTKTGVGSRIGCFTVDNENQVSVTGVDKTSKFIFNTGGPNTGAYMSIQKGGNEVIRITTDEVKANEQFFAFSTFKNISICNEEEDPTGKIITLHSKSFENFTKLNINTTIDVSYVRMKFLIKNNFFSTNTTVILGLYLGGKHIGTISNVEINGSQNEYDMLYPFSLPNSYSYTSEHKGELALELRVLSYSPIGTTHLPSMYIDTLSFGNAEVIDQSWDSETWREAEINTYTDNIKTRTLIGSNGISITNKNGTAFSFINTEDSVEFKVYGLKTEGVDNQLIQKDYSWSNVKKELRWAAGHYDSATDEDKLQFFNDLINAIPDDIRPLVIVS